MPESGIIQPAPWGMGMSLSFITNDPSSLLTKFKKAIDEGHVQTWAYDADGDFTHTPNQWSKKAWMRPQVASGQLNFNIMAPKTQGLSWEVYGVYHGRLAESVTAHLHDLFATASATARPSGGDLV
jgi:hypothetical protein